MTSHCSNNNILSQLLYIVYSITSLVCVYPWDWLICSRKLFLLIWTNVNSTQVLKPFSKGLPWDLVQKRRCCSSIFHLLGVYIFVSEQIISQSAPSLSVLLFLGAISLSGTHTINNSYRERVFWCYSRFCSSSFLLT